MPFDKTPKTEAAAALLLYASGYTHDTELVADHLMQQWRAEQSAAPRRQTFRKRSVQSSRSGRSGVHLSQRRNSAAAALELKKLPKRKSISGPAPKLKLHHLYLGQRVELDELYIDLAFLRSIEMQSLKRPTGATVMRATIERFFSKAGARLELASFRA